MDREKDKEKVIKALVEMINDDELDVLFDLADVIDNLEDRVDELTKGLYELTVTVNDHLNDHMMAQRNNQADDLAIYD